jgi:hypothetical protein
MKTLFLLLCVSPLLATTLFVGSATSGGATSSQTILCSAGTLTCTPGNSLDIISKNGVTATQSISCTHSGTNCVFESIANNELTTGNITAWRVQSLPSGVTAIVVTYGSSTQQAVTVAEFSSAPTGTAGTPAYTTAAATRTLTSGTIAGGTGDVLLVAFSWGTSNNTISSGPTGGFPSGANLQLLASSRQLVVGYQIVASGTSFSSALTLDSGGVTGSMWAMIVNAHINSTPPAAVKRRVVIP